MNKELIIELRGVEFVNKGAELMLYSILNKVRGWNNNVKFVMEHSKRAPMKKQRTAGIYTKAAFKKFRINITPLLSLVPSKILLNYGLIKEKDIDIVFDASGFAFGDQWGYKRAGFRLADHIKRWKKNHKLVIVLPQAFGPFTDSILIEKMEDIVKYADIIFARDKMSYDYLLSISKEKKNIQLKPDFTNITKAEVPIYFDGSENRVAIIPNSKMVETSKDGGKAYLNLLTRIATILDIKGEKPYFLIHESKMDRGIADEVNSSLTRKLPILQEENPLYVKGIIGASFAVITSRFHGLVSCLAQGVPCLATGWSHKYEMLLEDYKYSNALLDVNISDELLEDAVNSITDPVKSNEIRNKLKEESLEQKKRTEDMWNTVFDLIQQKVRTK